MSIRQYFSFALILFLFFNNLSLSAALCNPLIYVSSNITQCNATVSVSSPAVPFCSIQQAFLYIEGFCLGVSSTDIKIYVETFPLTPLSFLSTLNLPPILPTSSIEIVSKNLTEQATIICPGDPAGFNKSNDAKFTLTRLVFYNCKAPGAYGGGVLIRPINPPSLGNIIIQDCVFLLNSATGGGGALSLVLTEGVAIYISGCTFQSNRDAGFESSKGGYDIYLTNNGASNSLIEEFRVENCNFIAPSLTLNPDAFGASIHYSAGPFHSASNIFITNSNFTGYGSRSGGLAIHAEASLAQLQVLGCRFEDFAPTNMTDYLLSPTAKPRSAIFVGPSIEPSISIVNSFFRNTISAFESGSQGGSLTVTGCTFQNQNQSAIKITNQTYVHIRDSFFQDNHVEYTGGADLHVFPLGVMDPTQRQISIDSTHFSGGSALQGGSIHVNSISGDVTFSIDQSDFADYVSTDLAKGGGAILLEGESFPNIYIGSTTFTRCSAFASGGAISSTSANIDIFNSSFTNCSSLNHSGCVFIDFSYNSAKPTFDASIKSSTFFLCTAGAGSQGGGLYFSTSPSYMHLIELQNVSFANCTVERDGGGAFLSSNRLLFTNVDFEYCSSTSIGGRGGGLYVQQSLVADFTDITVSNCTALGIVGEGGGIHMTSENITLQSSRIISCDASSNGGGITAITNNLYMNNVVIDDCVGMYGQGGGLYASSMVAMPTFSFTGLNISNCHVYHEGGAEMGGGCARIQAVLGDLDIRFSSFTQCSTRENGGGLYASSSNLRTSTLTFNNCSALNYGGGLYIVSQMVDLSDTRIEYSISGNNGGGLYAFGADIISSDLTIDGSSSAIDGGCACFNASTVNMSRTTLTNCVGVEGGCMKIQASSNTTVDTFSLSNCTSNTFGGAAHMRSDTGSIYLSHGNVQHAIAYSSGGGLWLDGATWVNISHVDFYDCVSTYGHGGAVYSGQAIPKEPMLYVSQCTFTASRSNQNGGCVFLETDGGIVLESSTFDGCQSVSASGGAGHLTSKLENILRNSDIYFSQAFLTLL